jgi:hypothetical protein
MATEYRGRTPVKISLSLRVFRATGVGRFQRPHQLLRPVLQTVLLVVGILTAVAVYVISLMGFVWETRLAKADVQVAQK